MKVSTQPLHLQAGEGIYSEDFVDFGDSSLFDSEGLGLG
jgi:hypothetical protein